MKQSVVILAKSVIDISFGVESFPILPEQHQTILEKVITPGGPANQLFCGARLGLNMIAMNTVGKDDFGQLWVDRLAAEGIDVSQIAFHDHEPTPVTVVLTAPDGHHVFLAHRGEFNSGPEQFPDSWAQCIRGADALFLDGYSYRAMGPQVNSKALEIARSANVPVFFDPGPEIPFMKTSWVEEMVGGADVVLLTSQEAAKICGVNLEPEQLAQQILELGPGLVLLKLGAEGMIAHSQGESLRHPGFRVPVRDATGAGDSVTAAALLAYLKGFSLEKLLVLANATGAAAVQKLGAGINVPNRQEVQAILQAEGISLHF